VEIGETYDVESRRLDGQTSFRTLHIQMALDLRGEACVFYNHVALQNQLLISDIHRIDICKVFRRCGIVNDLSD
jgi:hypothetical protein